MMLIMFVVVPLVVVLGLASATHNNALSSPTRRRWTMNICGCGPRRFVNKRIMSTQGFKENKELYGP